MNKTNVSTDEFKQALLKYASRQAKSGKAFSLASIKINNCGMLLAQGGLDQVAHMTNSILAVIAKNAREVDRLCLLSPSLLLLLLGETTAAEAQKIITRLEQALTTNIRPLAQIKPVFSFQICPSLQHPLDLQELLAGAGCFLDEHGQLRANEQTRAISQSGSLTSWYQRYSFTLAGNLPRPDTIPSACRTAACQNVCQEIRLTEAQPDEQNFSGQKQEARDIWHNKTVIIISIPFYEHPIYGLPTYETLVRRARSLQRLVCINMQPLSDFYIEDRTKLYLSIDKIDGQLLFAQTKEFNESQIFQLTMEFVNILIQAQSMIPQMVIPFRLESFLVSQNRRQLMVIDYQLPYLLPEYYAESEAGNNNLETLTAFITQLGKDQAKCTIEKLNDLTGRIRAKNSSGNLNTMHKVRSALKNLLKQTLTEKSLSPAVENSGTSMGQFSDA